MGNKKVMVALDCGNSSFRTIVSEYENQKITTKVYNQTINTPIKAGEYFYWDILNIFQVFKNTLKQIAKDTHIDSIGVCTWGVDFSFFDKEGNMLSNPLCYRNTIGEEEINKLTNEEKKEIFLETGILVDKINSIYMLLGMRKKMPTIFSMADKLLMIPDILNYLLTGIMQNEPSELSTTQFTDARKRIISDDICNRFGIDKKLFSPIGKHGEKIGNLRKDILEEIGIDYDIPVICVPSHDTGSAILAIPANEENFGYVSCGTWSLVGTELDEPIFSDEVINANLTNETGAFNKITLLKNASGMFILNKLKQEYDFQIGEKSSFDTITEMAKNVSTDCVIDLNDISFFNPVSMSDNVWDYLIKTKQVTGKKDFAILFRTFYESLACCYADTFSNIEKIINKKLDKIYIVGGGARSSILVEMTAIHTGKPIVVCFGESTSTGNIAVQLKYFEKDMDIKSIREIIKNSFETKTITKDYGRENVLLKYKELTK